MAQHCSRQCSPVTRTGAWLASSGVRRCWLCDDQRGRAGPQHVFTWPAMSLARGLKHAQKPTFCAKRLRLCQLAHVCESKCTTRRGSPRSAFQTQRRPSPPHTGKASRDNNGSFRELSSFALRSDSLPQGATTFFDFPLAISTSLLVTSFTERGRGCC